MQDVSSIFVIPVVEYHKVRHTKEVSISILESVWGFVNSYLIHAKNLIFRMQRGVSLLVDTDIATSSQLSFDKRSFYVPSACTIKCEICVVLDIQLWTSSDYVLRSQQYNLLACIFLLSVTWG